MTEGACRHSIGGHGVGGSGGLLHLAPEAWLPVQLSPHYAAQSRHYKPSPWDTDSPHRVRQKDERLLRHPSPSGLNRQEPMLNAAMIYQKGDTHTRLLLMTLCGGHKPISASWELQKTGWRGAWEAPEWEPFHSPVGGHARPYLGCLASAGGAGCAAQSCGKGAG